MESWTQARGRNAAGEVSGPGAGPSITPVALADEIAALWSEHLDRCEVGTNDDFFTLGGNSLIGIKIIERVARDYGVVLSVRAFYLAQTPAGVAALIEQGRAQR